MKIYKIVIEEIPSETIPKKVEEIIGIGVNANNMEEALKKASVEINRLDKEE